MVANGAVEVEIEGHGERVWVRLKEDRATVMHPVVHPVVAPVVPAAAPAAGPAAAPQPATAAAPVRQGEVVKSPMVGTFYRASAPDADPFVKVGDRVKPETTICIIEAMKVMNEIKAECEGEILEVLAQNGEPVEFGQPLFLIKTS
jgi:acetyl-CoA carboxylase biotin carboxyl carrier protein